MSACRDVYTNEELTKIVTTDDQTLIPIFMIRSSLPRNSIKFAPNFSHSYISTSHSIGVPESHMGMVPLGLGACTQRRRTDMAAADAAVLDLRPVAARSGILRCYSRGANRASRMGYPVPVAPPHSHFFPFIAFFQDQPNWHLTGTLQ